MHDKPKIIIKNLGLQDYSATLKKMQEFTKLRDETTPDEIWFVEHSPIFTLGQAGKEEHILDPKNIPVIKSDRGGQVTYHGPGQIVIYFLLDLRRNNLNIREAVTLLEDIIIEFLAKHNITAINKKDAPGVYVNDQKICSIGLRVSRGKTYHGLAFNVDMDLEPFKRINPCGYKDLEVTQFKDLIKDISVIKVQEELKMIVDSRLRGNDAQRE